MQTLQNRLRQLRSWQHVTMHQLSQALPGMKIDTLCRLERGDGKAIRAQLNPMFTENAMVAKTRAELPLAYGLSEKAFRQLLEDEAEWRLCARDGNPEMLPRIARYIYRDLPEVARCFMMSGDFVVLDFETTGDPATDPHHPSTSIVDVAILDHDGYPLMSMLVNPEKPICKASMEKHGITDEMVANKPTFKEIYPQIAAIIEDKIVIVYNETYDISLLDKLIIQNHLDMPRFESWCLMRSYADFWKAPGKFPGSYAWQSLARACEQQHVTLMNAHRAYGDAEATFQLLKTLANK